MPRLIKVLPDRCVPFVTYSSPVLSTPVSARPGVSDHAHILGSILAPSRSVVAGDGVYDITVLAGNALPDPPALSSGRAGVGPAVH